MHTDKKETTAFQQLNVITVSLAHMCHDIYTAFLAPVLPLLISKLGISLSMVGLLDVIRKTPSLLNPFIGLVADKICVRYFIIFAPAVTGILMSLLGATFSYAALAALLFAVGISNALFHVPAPVMIKHLSANKTGRGMSYYMLGGEIARTAGPLIITAAVAWWGLEGSWRVMPIGIIMSIILFIKFRNLSINKDFQKKKKEFGSKETIKKMLPFFGLLAGITIFQTVLKSAFTLYLPVYMTEKGVSLWMAGISLSIMQLSGAIGTFFAGTLSDKFGRKKILLAAALINPVMILIFISCSGTYALIILFITGFTLLSSGPVMLALVQDTESEYPALLNGVYTMLSFFLSSLAVMAIGFSADWHGLTRTYQICAFAPLGAIPFILLLPKKK